MKPKGGMEGRGLTFAFGSSKNIEKHIFPSFVLYHSESIDDTHMMGGGGQRLAEDIFFIDSFQYK